MNDTAKISFNFTGPLRPGLITPRRFVPPAIVRPDYALSKDGISLTEQKSYNTNRPIKNSAEQVEAIRKAARHTRDVLDVAIRAAVPGVTTDAVDRAVHDAFVERGVYPSTLGYMKFPKSCCTSLNEVVCHGIPDSTVLQEGDIVNLDISGFVGGAHGDCNETIFVGKPTEESVRLVHTTYVCTMAGIAMCRPGAMYKHIGDTIAPIAEGQGYGVVRSVCGHGIGELFHCPPNVSHYANNKAVGQMAINHVFTVEPMINAGTWKDVSWPDDWTLVTLDGKRSAQFEHMVLITSAGNEILTLSNSWDKPYYQVQLEEWGIPLPEIIKVTAAAEVVEKAPQTMAE
ncbi:metallopeptidase, putative [Bodo saltans]|uniref:Methionine aminopeptidase n=1 Tax=Bodo saltans TaxID=75058 RepID=A0A0S4IXB9_BODSA|nr:metallopeptidase, putative [Bodo saltans]|eukprot:CUG07557.1 metallopeptidase, putative [Bodo saltans]